MRIVFITSKLNFVTSGASVTEFDLLIRTLITCGNEVTVVTLFSDQNRILNPLSYSVREESVATKGLWDIQKGIFRLLRKYESHADFFHLDGHLFLYGAGLYRLLGGRVPIAAYFNRELSSWPESSSDFFANGRQNLLRRFKQRLRWYVERYLLMPLAGHLDVISYSNPFLQKAYEDFGMRKGGEVMADPFDYCALMEKYGVTEDSYRSRNKPHGVITLFYSSRMAPGKGFDLLLAAFSEVKNKEIFRLVLGGDGPERPVIEQTIREQGLQKYITLPGWVSKDELYGTYFKTADIFIQARWRKELTACVILDALSFGLPCILPAGGGLAWVAKDAAFCFEDGNVADLARKIEELGNDAGLRARLSARGYARLHEDELNYKKEAARLLLRMQKVLS